MSKEADLAAKFWKALKSDRTVMLACPTSRAAAPSR